MYLDLAKAFDTVPHHHLLVKLKSYGIDDPVLAWIASFLRDRKQCVQVYSINSSLQRVVCGVPQGAVLRPLLFLIYVDDVDYVIRNAKLTKYPDGTKLYLSYCPTSVATPVSPLCADLHKFVAWCNLWKLRINFTKCQCLY